MKVKDLLENYQGDNYIEIYDCFSWQTKGFNNKEVAIRKYGHYVCKISFSVTSFRLWCQRIIGIQPPHIGN